MSKVDSFLKKTLGEDFLESLAKFELWKPGTKSVIDHEELRTALQIVPRTVIALLIRELSPMQIGENKEIALPVGDKAVLKISKHERDVYSGDIEEGSKKIAEFKFRALPGVGLVIMSAFELYDMDNLINSQNQPIEPSADLKIQKLIDERLALHNLIGQVIDKKLMEKDAIHELVMVKLTEALQEVRETANAALNNSNEALAHSGYVNEKIDMALQQAADKQKLMKKSRPLKDFLEKKQKEKEFSFHMAKGETLTCPDCKNNIFDGSIFSGCICLGDDMGKKVFLTKTEDGVKVRFSKSWDVENIEMLLEILQKKRR